MKSLGSEPVFFNTGVTAAVLKSEGTIPVISEEWMMAEERGGRICYLIVWDSDIVNDRGEGMQVNFLKIMK